MFDQKLCCFDLDDTLINTRATFDKALDSGLSGIVGTVSNFDPASDFELLKSICKSFGSENLKQGFRCYSSLRIGTLDPVVENQFYEQYKKTFQENLSCFPGAVKMLKNLSDRGKTLALISNSGLPEYQMEKILLSGLQGFFPEKLTLISGTFPPGYAKPFDRMFRELLKRTKESPENAVYAGNTLADILAAKSAGFHTIFFDAEGKETLPKLLQPDQKINTWENIE